MNLQDVILTPVVTEKSQDLETIGANSKKGTRMVKYTVKVHIDANKTLIKEAFKKIFKIAPSSVNIQVYRGKIKRFRNLPAPRPHWKKAVVTFRDGASIDFSKEA
ncbi:ribosomal protein L23 [Leptospira weilii serovar Topaz str. LT2116]|uniref:Large ribosomal subunit protein uL23 n=1 Tax=Leptospira weilii serovar Topaz str. LT2116 TaxID=1088540 RepID=M3FR37_9LEPT|nr:ribosomal protein L23 [Leptospira weilii serovar Topaz str. LT2116]